MSSRPRVLSGIQPTADSLQMLRTIYTELDLLVAECLRAGVFEELTAPELASCVAAAVFQARSSAEVGLGVVRVIETVDRSLGLSGRPVRVEPNGARTRTRARTSVRPAAG